MTIPYSSLEQFCNDKLVNPEVIFGPDSFVPEEVTGSVVSSPISSLWWYQLLAVACFVSFTVFFCLYRSNIGLILSSVFSFKRISSSSRRQNATLDGLVLMTLPIYTLTMGLFLIHSFFERSPLFNSDYSYFTFFLFSCLGAATYYLFKRILILLIDTVTEYRQLSDQLASYLDIHLCFEVCVFCPVCILSLLVENRAFSIFFFLFAVLFILSILLSIKDIILLFRANGISTLHCFLYLCTAEIFPASLFYALISGVWIC